MNRSDHRSDSCLKMFENYINAILMSESVFFYFCCSSGDNPDDVKARLKYWAQAVACTVQLCS